MAASILNPLVSQSFSPADEGSAVTQAVAQLTQAYNATPTDDFLWSFWNTLLVKTVPSLAEGSAAGSAAAAATVPDVKFDPFPTSPALDRLVSLVKELKNTEVKEIEAWGEKRMMWTDLPLFGPQVREVWDRDPTSAAGGKKKAGMADVAGLDEEEVRKWLVSVKFIVSLVGEGVLEVDHLPIWSLRSALEEEEVEGEERETTAARRDVRVSVAAIWLKDCGSKIWDKCVLASVEGKELEGPLKQMTRPGKLYDGPAWFSRERWEFWGNRMQKLKEEGGLGESANERVEIALGVMEGVSGTKMSG